MAAPTRIQIAKADIFRHFDELPTRIFKRADIAAILTEQRGFWRLAQKTNTDAFIDFLVRAGKLKRYDFNFPSRLTQAFAWGDAPLLEIVLTLRPRAYLSHYTAVRVHGLTGQVPKSIYVTHEPLELYARRESTLTQDALDAAFQKPERITQDVALLQDQRIYLINGVGTGGLGIIDMKTRTDAGELAHVRVSSLERTLIDITVRPGYAGGAAEVLQAFREAREKTSVNRLRAMLLKLAYVYPYHQALGFYFERAGYSAPALEMFRELPRPLRFHLAHAMGETDYVKEWNLYIPRGL